MAVDPALLARFSSDRALAALVLFAHRHPQEDAAMHTEIMDLFASADEFIQIEAFRESGKTTKAEEYITLAGCYRTFNYGLLLGETYEKACQRLSAIDYECRTNEALQRLFGGPVLARKSIENKMWFASGFHLHALGWEQELQSFKYLDSRPDFAFLDDVENPERVRDAAAVDVSMHKLYHDLIPAMDKTRRKIINSQTRRAEDCMVTRLAKNPMWLYRGFPICDRDPDDPLAESAWPARYPMGWIRKEKASFQGSGMLSAFLQAYMLQTVNPERKPFKEDMFAEMEMPPYHWMPRYAIYDPSRTSRARRSKEEGEKSDRTGKVVVSKMGSKILVHESSGSYWKPDEFVDDVFATQAKHDPAKVGIEKNSLDDWLLQPIRIQILRRGMPVALTPLQAPQDRSKDEFIMGLLPFATAKDIVLIGGKMAHPQLVAEWRNFPSGPRDIMNALAYSLRMFSGVPLYEDFGAANIGEAPVPRRGETVYVAIQATAVEVAAACVLREGRRLSIAADFAQAGAIADAVRTIAFEIRTAFPQASLQAWIPADTYDQQQRVGLVSALQVVKMTPYRAEHAAVARGVLSERIRSTWRNQKMLIVDRNARRTLNALSAGYALTVERGGRLSKEPEQGISRLIGEALECMVSHLDKLGDVASGALPEGANVGVTPGGNTYVTANPRARA